MGTKMLDQQLISHVKRHGDHYEARPLVAFKNRSGIIKEMCYSRYDNCFYVMVDGREKFRGDTPETVFDYFCDAAPD
jgi:hypothetical protein